MSRGPTVRVARGAILSLATEGDTPKSRDPAAVPKKVERVMRYRKAFRSRKDSRNLDEG